MTDRHEPTEEEIRDAIVDRQHKYFRSSPDTDDLYPVDKYTIVEIILGFDPVGHNNTNTQFGGKSKDSYINPYLSMTALQRLLDQMVEEGVLAKVNAPTWRDSNDPKKQRLGSAVRFYNRKAGYVMADALDEAYVRLDAGRRNNQRAKLMKAAREEIADKYAKQVTTAYRRMCKEAGLDPEEEITSSELSTDDDNEF